MPLVWTHEKCAKPACDGTTNCPNFPTVQDRVNMARAAYSEYAEADGTSLTDFALDALLLLQSERPRSRSILMRLAKRAFQEWKAARQQRR
jgi:hypothetical protein